MPGGSDSDLDLNSNTPPLPRHPIGPVPPPTQELEGPVNYFENVGPLDKSVNLGDILPGFNIEAFNAFPLDCLQFADVAELLEKATACPHLFLAALVAAQDKLVYYKARLVKYNEVTKSNKRVLVDVKKIYKDRADAAEVKITDLQDTVDVYKANEVAMRVDLDAAA